MMKPIPRQKPGPRKIDAARMVSTTAVVLVRELGSRLGDLAGPRAALPLLDRTWLEWILSDLPEINGLGNVILSVPERFEELEALLPSLGKRMGVKTDISIEGQPLGTVGALGRLAPDLAADVLVIDTPARLEIDLDAFMMTHRQTRARVTMAAVQVDYPQRFGVVTLGKDRVRGFRDKIPMNGEIPADWAGTKPGWINGGIYCIEADLLQRLSPTSQESLAHDVFPRWVDRPGIVPFTRTGYFQPLDTPQSRQAFVADLESGEAEGYKV